jgi:hypothetical protein
MSRRSERLRDERVVMNTEQGYRCATCHLALPYEGGELAHKIPNAVWAKAKYGPRVIDHRLNKVLTHPGFCNDQQNLQNKPLACDRLAAEIRKELESE